MVICIIIYSEFRELLFEVQKIGKLKIIMQIALRLIHYNIDYAQVEFNYLEILDKFSYFLHCNLRTSSCQAQRLAV
jgi:hypothetical protein